MTTRYFDALFSPRSIALIGASNRPGSVGRVLASNLMTGGFKGDLAFVNTHESSIDSYPCVHDVGQLAQTPELAVIATPSVSVPPILTELHASGCRAAIVISAGDRSFNASLLETTQRCSMRVLGPNCLGMMSPVSGINASFAQLTPRRGALALVTQSGAIATSVLDWAHNRGIGFSHILSLGDMIDVDFGDVLDYLALDAETHAILLYVEQITHARKFLSAARIAARAKPVIIVKAGRSTGGAKAAQSHTGALAGADAVYDAAFRRAGMLRVDTVRELFDAAETLSSDMRPAGDRLMIVTNGGGLGVLATDALEQGGGSLAALSDDAKTALEAVLPRAWSRNNPIDILGDATGARYGGALRALSSEVNYDALLVMNCPTGVTDNADCARAVIDNRPTIKPILSCWMGGANLDAPRSQFRKARIPCFDAPEDAVRAFLHLNSYGQNQRTLLETPAPSADRAPGAKLAVSTLIAQALSEGRSLLNAYESKTVLTAYGVDAAQATVAADAEGAEFIASALRKPVALKILSSDISHKSDVGGVALNLEPRQVAAAARAMQARVRKMRPDVRIEGFTVEPMIDRAGAHELVIGASVDPTFGPIILFGQGGVGVEVIGDTAIALPPLNASLAANLIKRTRIARLLAGFRDRPPANLHAISDALIAVSDLIIDHAEIVELDINPLLADEHGAIALDARIVVRRAEGETSQRLSISSYPSHLVQTIALANGECYQLRPLRPQDAPLLLDLGARTSVDDIRLRFHGNIKVSDPLGAARLSQLDYDREMALIACESNGAAAGVARVHFDPQIETGEFAVIVRTDLRRQGLALALMQALITYARDRGAKTLSGFILRENVAMLELARALGANLSPLNADRICASIAL